MSEMSWLMRVTSSCCRVASILKSRSSGCVYCADHVGVYCGLIVAVMFDVCRAAVVEGRREIAAAPRHVLHEPAVEHERGVVDGRAGLPAGNRARGRVLRALRADERRHRRAVDRSDARDVDVVDLLADALDRDVEVVLERALHRVLERQRHARAARLGAHGQRNRRRLARDRLARREKVRRQLQSGLRRRRNRHNDRKKGVRKDLFHIEKTTTKPPRRFPDPASGTEFPTCGQVKKR